MIDSFKAYSIHCKLFFCNNVEQMSIMLNSSEDIRALIVRFAADETQLDKLIEDISNCKGIIAQDKTIWRSHLEMCMVIAFHVLNEVSPIKFGCLDKNVFEDIGHKAPWAKRYAIYLLDKKHAKDGRTVFIDNRKSINDVSSSKDNYVTPAPLLFFGSEKTEMQRKATNKYVDKDDHERFYSDGG